MIGKEQLEKHIITTSAFTITAAAIIIDSNINMTNSAKA